MFTVHTDAPGSFTEREVGVRAIKGGDCYYGWGEKRVDKDICPRHNLLQAPTLEAAEHVAAALIACRYQAVITTAEDWSVVVTGATTPIYYLASHEH